jgi:NAD(P)H-hydrate epimerase
MLLAPHTEMIVTPHLGEMARLTKDTVSLIQTGLLTAAADFANAYDVICVLKDFRTVTAIPYGRTYLNLSGNAGMATAGSGDVLAGLIGSLLAQGMQPRLAAPLGVCIHGLAGDKAKEQCGERALLASDIIQGVRKLAL